MAELIRNPTEDESRDFIAIAKPGNEKYESPEDKLARKIAEERLKAQVKRDKDNLPLPFADQAVRAEWKEFYDVQVAEHKKKYGFVKAEEIKIIKLDWSKYSDLKNFDLLREYEMLDDGLSKRYAKPVHLKCKEYQFKGYYKKYQVMEDGMEAVARINKAEKMALKEELKEKR